MKKSLKIATIGGGSSYTPELIEGFINRYDELPISELWLVDVEEGREKLEIVGALAKRMVEKAGVPIQIHLTMDREEALKNADFVTTQFRVGRLEARMLDESIPLKYDVIGQETNGPGGLFKGLRTIPVILDICRDIERLCPDAWLVNFTNPAGMVTEAVLRYSNITKVVGLCNGPIGIEKGIAKELGVDTSRIYVEFAGLNHMVFAKNVYLDGKNVTPTVMEKMTKNEDGISLKNIADVGWDPLFLNTLGMVPIGYLRYYYQTSIMLAEQKAAVAKEGTRAEVVKRVETELFELYKNLDLAEKPKQLEQRGGAYYSEAACNLIHSIYNDKRDIQTVNTRNNGAVAGIDPDSAVEVNCVITSQGPIPLTTGPLPIAVNGLVQSIKSFERLAAEAAVTGDYNTALLAMTINPLVPSDAVAHQLLDELLEAHQAYLPQFNK
ncbi:6-phospho-beta-glucosidase [Listeria newyorkensis]|uniref:6-phospho-beta-glucosidase n=1 Tax=Listeria newyorkensis TaxID=1497681 RepID=A0ABX4XMP1_9LIST|nr:MULTISPECIES: 6-phospho-beta-glucosidase [Listeria]KGL42295.1 diacetylchitobiose-6-phosphate hydrolase [Listeriaceae bacterium FSL A5-0209]KGL38725.1 diacetylchitobiose-6-phosphate hydrolase [Listeria newyorkensis]PNP92696.1 6-phospho-beta-glucosidase [Listeria newyorkensis]RQW66495.1 6-phospho-beta-glucosidase [Listeria sp. SHR_NRA_18]WAO23099.1 6-phospho-beta-glucosidase [Listeria newyorkensis]